jgi:ABC-type glycerol-3-phosphate transport system substrate-binding protein
MKKFHNIWFVLLTLVLVFSLVGCGKEATPTVDEPVVEEAAETEEAVVEEVVETEEAAADETTPTEEVVEVPAEIGVEGCRIPAPAEPTVVNVIGWSYPIIDFYFQEIEKCNGVENLTINTQLMDSGSAGEQIRLAAAAGGESTYDIILNSGGNVQELADMGALYPLDDFMAQYEEQYAISDIVGWPDAMHNGVTYAIPIENNTEFFFYRADLWEKYNLQTPDTWNDVIAACEVLQAEESIDFPGTLTLYAGWAWDLEFSQMLGAQGVTYLDENNMPQFTGPEGVAAVEMMMAIAEACMGDEGLTYSIDDSEVSMETGGQAWSFTWASRGANMDNPEKSLFVGGINFSPAPRFSAGGVYGAYGGGASLSIMSGTAVDPDLLFQIIMEVTDYDTQVEAAKLGIASRMAVADVATARYYEAAMTTIDGGIPSSYNPATGLASTALSNWLPLVLTGEYTIQEVLDNAAAEYIEQAQAAGYIQ